MNQRHVLKIPNTKDFFQLNLRIFAVTSQQLPPLRWSAAHRSTINPRAPSLYGGRPARCRCQFQVQGFDLRSSDMVWAPRPQVKRFYGGWQRAPVPGRSGERRSRVGAEQRDAEKQGYGWLWTFGVWRL